MVKGFTPGKEKRHGVCRPEDNLALGLKHTTGVGEREGGFKDPPENLWV
jgi:hypothetical protein